MCYETSSEVIQYWTDHVYFELIMYILSAIIFEASFNKEISNGYIQEICVITERTKLFKNS